MARALMPGPPAATKPLAGEAGGALLGRPPDVLSASCFEIVDDALSYLLRRFRFETY
jgi:hypothetical protein